MSGGKFRTFSALGALAVALSACAGLGDIERVYGFRWGPDPAMPPTEFHNVIADQVKVISYIETYVPPSEPNHYYQVALSGFNIGRQDCEIYMNVLYKINREKVRNAGIITAVSTAVTAVVGVAGSLPSTTLSILGASFGLLSALNEAYFTTYLFSDVPGIVAKKVAEQQETYQASLTPVQVQTAADAYQVIRAYYQICLPETIEGTFLQQVAGGEAETKPPENKTGPTPARINTLGSKTSGN
jgi:hypothetical protein